MSARLLKRLVKPPAQFALGFLGLLESALLPPCRLTQTPIFIIGVPRSGTTLLYQLIDFALPTCYFTNLTKMFRGRFITQPPLVLSAWLAKKLRLIEHRKETFESRYGTTEGWGNPSDTGDIWRHWFSKGYYVGTGVLPYQQKRYLCRAVAWTERIFGRAFVDKTVDNTVRILALDEIFPTACFVQCIRSPLAIAQSLYIGRMEEIRLGMPYFYTDYPKPREYERIKNKGLVEQTCELVYYIDRNMHNDKAALSADRFLTVEYESLCNSPEREIRRVAQFMKNHGISVERIKPVPPSFPISQNRRIDSGIYHALIYHLERLYDCDVGRLDEP
jgi:hypothetical protein